MTSFAIGLIGMLTQGCGEKGEIETMKPEPTSVIPAPTEASPFTPPTPVVSKLDGGGELWLLEDHDLPVVVFSVVITGGSADDSQDKLGTAELANQMLLEGSGERTSSEVSSYLYGMAVDVSVQTTRRHTILNVSAHKDRLSDALAVVSDMVYAPQFDQDDWERVMEQHLAGLQQSRQDGSWVASHYAPYFLYGAGHPLGRSTQGTPSTLETISPEDAKAWHMGRLKGGAAQLGVVAVGDIDAATVQSLVSTHFNQFPTLALGEFVTPTLADHVVPTPRTILVDMPGAEQTSIRVLAPAYKSGDEREIAADLAGVVMGGTFTSRLNAKLREEKGYTYGAGCSFSGGYYGNHLSVRTNVQTKYTVAAIQDLNAVLATAQEGFSIDDHSKALSSYRGDFIQMSASRKYLASEMVDLFRLSDPADLWVTDLTTSQAVTPEQMKATADLFDTKRGVTVLVGDAEVVEPMLTEAGIIFEKATIPE